MSTDWYPAEYRPSRGWPLARYSTMPSYVRLIDMVALRLRERRQTFWRKARDNALAEWPIFFRVIEQMTGYECEAITLDIADAPGDIGGWADHETTPCPTDAGCDCSWAWVDLQMWQAIWQSKDRGHLRYIIGHEVGHCLGFGHDRSGHGIMQDPIEDFWPHVNAEERAALAAFWETP